MAGPLTPLPASPRSTTPSCDPLTIAGKDVGILSGGAIRPPLVSIVLIALNNERFVGATIDSIRAQDYALFECFVIDNGSTDATPDAIRRHIGDDPRFTAIFRTDNAGQLGAFMEVFDRLRGEFVMSVDSDDTLLANAVSVHLQVHLAMVEAVGVTTSHFVQTDADGRILLSGGRPPPRPPSSGTLNNPTIAMRLPTISDEDYRLLQESVARLKPDEAGWLWSPGTGNMVRRSALVLALPSQRVSGPDFYVDGHFLPLCHGLMGTAFISLPLSTYRLHGNNVHTGIIAAPSLNMGHPHQEALRRKRMAASTATVLDDPARFVSLVGAAGFWRLVDQVCRRGGRRGSDPVLTQPFAAQYAALVRTFGTAATLSGLLRTFRPSAVRRIVAAGAGRGASPPEDLAILALEVVGRAKGSIGTLRRRVRDYLLRRPSAAPVRSTLLPAPAAAALPEPAAAVEPTLAGREIDALSGGSVKPPLVSIVVIAWNNRKFVGQTIDSIRAQDYTLFECLVVDNGSTDGTQDVIREHVGDDPRFTTLFRADNAGQLGAFMELFDRLRGEFVMIVDSDDTLLANAVSVHLQVHLGLADAVGFTSCHFIQIGEDGRALLSGGRRVAVQASAGVLNDLAFAFRLPTVSEADYRRIERAVTRYAPGAANAILSPGSANMFRRSALDLTRPPHPVTGEHLYFDGHFMPLCYGVVGAAFIAWPLSTYRLHGGNVALGTALLPGLNPFKPHEDQWRKVRFAECSATVLHDAERLVVLIGARRYWSLLESVSRRGGRRVDDPVLREPFEKRYATLAGVFGNTATLRGLLGIFTPSAVRRIAAAGKGRRLDPAELLLISALDLVGRVAGGFATLRRRVRDYLIRRT